MDSTPPFLRQARLALCLLEGNASRAGLKQSSSHTGPAMGAIPALRRANGVLTTQNPNVLHLLFVPSHSTPTPEPGSHSGVV